MTTILHKRSSVANNVPTTSDLDLGELAINTYDGNIFLKRNQDGLEEILKFVSKVPVENVIYVQKAGNDNNDGNGWDTAFLTIERALQEANTRNGAITLIDIGPGIYETQGHLDMPDNCMIRAVHRSVVMRPESGYEERNVFRMGSGCFIEGPIFEGWRLDDLDNPTEGFAVCFRPGAIITRVPYAHKIAVRTNPTWTSVAPPLDRDNANPYVGRGAGVALADGLVCSPYSIYPNIMTWGATPVTHNGIGYVAKNGGLINAVNAISIWCHKHFLALSGGQIVLSSCSTQFGDYTMVSSGVRQLIQPIETSLTLTVQSSDASLIEANTSTIIDTMWSDLVSNEYTATWDAEDEEYTRTDAATFLQSIIWVLQTANEKPILDFTKGLYDTQGDPVFSSDKTSAFIFSFQNMRDQINGLSGFSSTSQTIVTDLVSNLVSTINSPTTVAEPSTITAIGHTWTGIMAGVALTKIPPARNLNTIEESILELNNGIVIASGQDDQGSALFIGGMKIDADTGELSGPPFEQAVNRIATRAAIARSF